VALLVIFESISTPPIAAKEPHRHAVAIRQIRTQFLLFFPIVLFLLMIFLLMWCSAYKPELGALKSSESDDYTIMGIVHPRLGTPQAPSSLPWWEQGQAEHRTQALL
jgi:hypothetical protein